MLFHDSKDESAWGLSLAGFIVVLSAIILGNVTADVQPKAPVEIKHTDVSSPDLKGHVPEAPHTDDSSPYPQPKVK